MCFLEQVFLEPYKTIIPALFIPCQQECTHVYNSYSIYTESTLIYSLFIWDLDSKNNRIDKNPDVYNM